MPRVRLLRGGARAERESERAREVARKVDMEIERKL